MGRKGWIVVCIFTVIFSFSIVINIISQVSEENKDLNYTNGEEKPNSKREEIQTGIVVDLGSSGTRVSIFAWDKNHSVQPAPYDSNPFFFHKVSDGIAKKPELAQNYLIPLLDKVLEDLKSINVSQKQYRIGK